MKKFRLGVLLLLCLLLCTSCGTGSDHTIKVLMEASTAEWTTDVEKACRLNDLGRPLGTAREEYEKKDGVWEIRFSIDEEMTQVLIDGYAKSVWNACYAINSTRPHSSNYYIYDNLKEACRQQEPLDYYIWYYFAENQEFRVGIYPTMLEEGEPGGLVLRIERWE